MSDRPEMQGIVKFQMMPNLSSKTRVTRTEACKRQFIYPVKVHYMKCSEKKKQVGCQNDKIESNFFGLNKSGLVPAAKLDRHT